MDILNSYDIIIGASIIVILSFLYGEISRKTNIPSVLMLIFTGIVLKLGMDYFKVPQINFFPVLEILGIVGLIMIVLEAALELELKREKLLPILKALLIALISLVASSWAAAELLYYYIPDMSRLSAWIYAVPVSILSSAVIIPSVTGLGKKKREFHIYESTFSDILGIMFFYFLTGRINAGQVADATANTLNFFGDLGLTILLSLIAGYALILVFQNIRSQVKLFLLISTLILLYAVGKKMHFSSLIIILIFGLLIANMKLFFQGKIGRFLNPDKAKNVYDGLHVITGETAFVVRTFFFVVFGITITLSSLLDAQVALVSGLILLSIYIIRFIILRLFLGKDIFPQLFIAPRGLITILLFYAIPKEVRIERFDSGILLFVIIATGIFMSVAMVYDKQRSRAAIKRAENRDVGFQKWRVPQFRINDEEKDKTEE